MIAEIRPQTGGAPEAIAIPSESGIPIMATCIPAIRSYRQCLRPFTPFSGFSLSGTAPPNVCIVASVDIPHLLNFRVSKMFLGFVTVWFFLCLMVQLNRYVAVGRLGGRVIWQVIEPVPCQVITRFHECLKSPQLFLYAY